MTVFLAHAPADRASAEALEKFLERRGQFVELDDGHTAMAPVQPSDVLVALLSKDLVFAPTRLRLEQRALDAWAQQRLIVVRLDKGLAPVGLGDLPSIDASFEAKREFTWAEVANAIRERTRLAPSAPDAAPARGQPMAPKKPGEGADGAVVHGAVVALGLFLLAIPGLVVAAALVSIWLVNRIGPRPGGWAELRVGVDALGARYGLAPIAIEIAFGAALVITLIVIGVFMARMFARPKRRRERGEAPAAAVATEAAAQPSNAVFVSYARANAAAVAPVIEGAKNSGGVFWMDEKNIGAGDSWAGEIVRAIRGAANVVVMCSKAAFESDHVKREIYLADRYKKRLVPVFIEDATPPEDFEYFFAGVQLLKLFETPEAERPQALVAALGANT
jgi:hypothetical protein